MATPRTHLTIREVCERLALSRWTVYRAIRMGSLRAVRFGRAVRIPVGELSRWTYYKTSPTVN